MTESFFAERGLYYRTNKFEDGRKTLVFIHGLSGSSSAWREYEARFENEYNILTFDQRGHGESARPTEYGQYEIGRFASDLKALLDSLMIDKCIVIGHSFGAATALEFLLQHPDRVTRAVLLSPDFYTKGIKLSRYVFPLISRLAGLAGFFPVHRHAGRHVDYAKYPHTGDWNLWRMTADISNTGLHVYLYCLKQLYGFDLKDHLGEIAVPVLVIHGAKDTVVPCSNSISLVEKIKGSRIVVLNGANHILVLNNIPEVSRLIEDFVK